MLLTIKPLLVFSVSCLNSLAEVQLNELGCAVHNNTCILFHRKYVNLHILITELISAQYVLLRELITYTVIAKASSVYTTHLLIDAS